MASSSRSSTAESRSSGRLVASTSMNLVLWVPVRYSRALMALRICSLAAILASRRLRKESASSMKMRTPRGLRSAQLNSEWISVTASAPSGTTSPPLRMA